MYLFLVMMMLAVPRLSPSSVAVTWMVLSPWASSRSLIDQFSRPVAVPLAPLLEV